ncbi:hypothetical protein K3495_g7730 [Podosphaera aphanis]|nr:hypothetical protein K3495_g7730 [Podosphaera aphanis]
MDDSASATYQFPHNWLRLTQSDTSRMPLVFVACGSFSPVTYLHLRMFELGRDFARCETKFEVMGGYISPVSDLYKKAGLAEATDRLKMCELAVNEIQDWVMVDPWEAQQSTYMRTAQVLDHFEYEINEVLGGAARPDGTRVPMKIVLLAGADLIQTMSTPGVWNERYLKHILGNYGIFVVERDGTNLKAALAELEPWRSNIWVVQQHVHNDISSTKVRLLIRHGLSVRYLIPASVIRYIEGKGLFKDPCNHINSTVPSSPATENQPKTSLVASDTNRCSDFSTEVVSASRRVNESCSEICIESYS